MQFKHAYQVVRGLVEDDDVRGGEGELGERHPRLLSAGEVLHLDGVRVRLQPEGAELLSRLERNFEEVKEDGAAAIDATKISLFHDLVRREGCKGAKGHEMRGQ